MRAVGYGVISIPASRREVEGGSATRKWSAGVPADPARLFHERCAKRTQETLVLPMILKKRDSFRPHFGTILTTFETFQDIKNAFVDVLNMVWI